MFDGSFDLLLKCKVLFCCKNNGVLNTVICASIVLAHAVCISAKISRTLSSHTILSPKSVDTIFVFNYTVPQREQLASSAEQPLPKGKGTKPSVQSTRSWGGGESQGERELHLDEKEGDQNESMGRRE